MSTLNDTDLFIIERSGTNYQVRSEEMSELLDTDLFVVERDGVNYKLAAEDLDIVPPEVPVVSGTISDLNTSAGRFTDEQFKIDISVQDAAKRTDQEVKPYVVATYVPEYDLHGLRFDPDRDTQLSRGLSIAPTDCTVSAWVKQTNNGSYKALFQASGLQLLQNSGGFNVNNFGTAGTIDYASVSSNVNKWQHVVGQYTSTGVSVWVDGVLAGTAAAARGSTSISEVYVGYYSVASEAMPGYLSDVYFVEAAVPASVFGGAVDGVWLPKTYDEVVAEIPNYPLNPYDQRANTDEVWSSSGGDMSSAVNAYDGTTATNGTISDANTGSPKTFLVSQSIANVSSLSVAAGTGGEMEFFVNDVSVGTYSDASAVGTQFNKTFTFDPVTLNKLSVKGPNSAINVYGVKVNGRLLVDSTVWNNSQNWSDYLSSPAPSSSGAVFDGNDAPTSTSCTVTVAEPFKLGATVGVTGTITVRAGVRSIAQGNATATISVGSQVLGTMTSPNSGDSYDQTFNYSGTIGPSNLLSIEQVSNGVDFFPLKSIYIDGALLVDSGAQWNTSQVWSDYFTSSAGFTQPVVNAFDGNLSSFYAPDTNQLIVWELPVALPVSTSLEFYARIETSVPVANIISVTYSDGTSETVNYIGNQSNSTFYYQPADSAAGKSLKSFTFTGNNGTANTNQLIAGIKVDGEILVDQGSFGANGFYLPFDPEATGEVWSDYGTGNTGSGGEWANAFDGSLSSISFPASGTLTWTPPSGIPFTTLQFAGYKDSTPGTLRINGVDVTSQLSNSPISTVTITGVTSPLTSIESISNAPTANIGFAAVIVDGVVLVDHNSIGVDASGNNNDFHDQNFGVGNTSQVWSNSTTRPNTNIPTAYTPINMFDGSLSTDCRQDPESSPILFEPTGLSYASSLRVHVTSVNNANQVITVVTSAGTESKIGNTFGPNGTGVWVEFTANPGTIISVSQVTDIGIVNAIQAVEVDGEILVDTNQQDTVTDTPVMAYAVLDSTNSNVVGKTFSNGNLVVAQDDSVSSPAFGTLAVTSGKYYWETTPPTVSQGYEVGIGNSTATYTYVSDGRKDINAAFSSYGAAYGDGDTIGIALDMDAGSATFYKNGVSQGVAFTGLAGQSLSPLFLRGGGGTMTFVSNFGQQPFVASNVTYNQATGIATIDGVDYSTLFQEPINSGSSGGSGSSPSGSYSSGRLYLVLDPNGNVVDMQSEDPGYTAIANAKDYTITWPLVLPSGEAPDTELPEGTQICSYVKSTNDAGSDEALTNHLTPT